MNLTPRRLNRFLTALLGLLLLGIGLSLVLLSSVPQFAAWWQDWARDMVARLHRLSESTALGEGSSWLWLIMILVPLLIALLAIYWMAQQGKGRVGLIVEDDDDSPVPGDVTISANVVEQMLRTALAGRPDVLGVSLGAYQYAGITGLRVKIFPRKGASPQGLVKEVDRLIDGFTAELGRDLPTLIHISSGTRAAFTREERVH